MKLYGYLPDTNVLILIIVSAQKRIGTFSSGPTLSKKRNAIKQAVAIFSALLIGQRVLDDSFIRQVIDLFGVFIQVEQHLFQCVIPEFGTSHSWSVVTSAVCCSDRLFFQLITWSGAKILPGFAFVSGHQGLHD